MKIGLFGGTFNPIHLCHLKIAAQVRDRLSLDQVLFIPTGDPPHKSSDALAPAHHRFGMVKAAIADTPSFSASDVEITRAAKSYSIDTVRALRQTHAGDDLSFILGLDAFLELPSWREASELITLCHFVAVSRTGLPFQRLAGQALLPPIPPASLAALDNRAQDRLSMPLSKDTTLTLVTLPPCDISASDIRKRISQKLPVSALLPASVESYIMRANLYQEEADRTRVEGDRVSHRPGSTRKEGR